MFESAFKGNPYCSTIVDGRHRSRAVFPLALSLMTALAASNGAVADTLYDTFGAGDSYDTSVVWENGPFGSIAGYNAMTFELGPGDFTNIAVTLPLSQDVSGDPSEFWFQVKIYANDGMPWGEEPYPDEPTPGTLLGLIDGLASDLPQEQPGGPPLTTFDFGSLMLTGGTRYWLAIETTLDATFSGINWHVNDQGVSEFKAQRLAFTGQPFPDDWNLLGPGEGGMDGAMRVTGTAVPAPAGLAVLLGASMAARTRRRR